MNDESSEKNGDEVEALSVQEDKRRPCSGENIQAGHIIQDLADGTKASIGSGEFDKNLTTVIENIDGVIESVLRQSRGVGFDRDTAISQLSELNTSLEKLRMKGAKIICLQLDMSDPNNFSIMISAFSEVITDKYLAASIFSISVSTFYRWKSGETIPSAAFRRFAQRQIADFFLGDGTGIELFPAADASVDSVSSRSATSDLLSKSTRRLLN
jgi:hypothetical protein